jgi:hypothetical protein
VLPDVTDVQDIAETAVHHVQVAVHKAVMAVRQHVWVIVRVVQDVAHSVQAEHVLEIAHILTEGLGVMPVVGYVGLPVLQSLMVLQKNSKDFERMMR